MSSVKRLGIRFAFFPDDHEPRHVHAFYAGIEVIVELREGGVVVLARRPGSVSPANAKRADVGKILRVAAWHFDELIAAWEKMHP